MRRRIAIAAGLLCLLAAPAAGADNRDWARTALGLQYELASDVELRNTPWVYTHNSFNSVAEVGPTLSARDPNQTLTLVDQLDEGVRSLEIDEHLYTSPQDPRVGGRGPVVCHARGEDQGHAGCTTEKPLVVVLREVRGWLDRHPRQVLLLYLESHLESPEGYAAGADSVEEALGPLVYRPAGRGSRCEKLPLKLTRDQIRRAGKQVLLMGPCGEGNRWQGYVFDEEPRKTGSDNGLFRAFPNCGPDFTRKEYDRQVIRYYEDGTRLSARGERPHGPDQRHAGRADGALRRGPGGPRLPHPRRPAPGRAGVELGAGQPAGRGACSVQRADGRWEARSCTQRHRVACRDARRRLVRAARTRVAARSAARACASVRVTNGVPRTGFDGQQLRVAMGRAGCRRRLARTAPPGRRLGSVREAGLRPAITRPRKRRRVIGGVAEFVVRLRLRLHRRAASRRAPDRGATAASALVRSRTGRLTRVPVACGTPQLTCASATLASAAPRPCCCAARRRARAKPAPPQQPLGRP